MLHFPDNLPKNADGVFFFQVCSKISYWVNEKQKFQIMTWRMILAKNKMAHLQWRKLVWISTRKKVRQYIRLNRSYKCTDSSNFQ